MGAIKQARRKKTARELAERLGVSTRTIQRYIAQPRTEYEAHSIEKAKPWEALGISRATWYRRGKPDQWQRYARALGVGFEVSEA